jgi:hypothetical protein
MGNNFSLLQSPLTQNMDLITSCNSNDSCVIISGFYVLMIFYRQLLTLQSFNILSVVCLYYDGTYSKNSGVQLYKS